MRVDKGDLIYKKADNNRAFILNRETGRWYVGEIDNNIDRIINNLDEFDLNDSSKLIQKLWEQNILHTDYLQSIEQPYSDELSLLIIDTTNKCNLKCKYCFVDATSKGDIMNIETAINALTMALDYPFCADTLTIEFSGGEPLLNFALISDFIPQAIEISKNKGKKLTFTIQTNGTLFTNQIIDFLIKYNVNIGISIDGTEEFHDKNRIFENGNGSLNIIKNNIKLLQEKGGHVSILAVITSEDQYESVIKFALENKIKNIRTNLVTKVGRAENKDCYTLEFSKLAQKYIVMSEKMIKKEIPLNDATLTFYLWNLLLSQPHMCFRSPCGAGRNQISVTANGNIFPCQGWRNIKTEPIGNVNEKPELDKMLKNNPLAKKLVSREVRKLECCNECNWKFFCGICPRELYSETGDIYGTIPQCEFQNQVFEGLIWMFDNYGEEIKEYLIGE